MSEKAWVTGIADQRSYEGSVEQISGAAPAEDQKHSHEEFNTVKNTIDQHAPLIEKLMADLLGIIAGSVGVTLASLKNETDALNSILSADDTTLDTAQERVDKIKQLLADIDSLVIADIAGLQTSLDSLQTGKEAKGVAQTLITALENSLLSTPGLFADIALIQSTFDQNPDVVAALRTVLTVLDTEGYGDSGYPWAVVDAASNILLAINNKGELVAKISISNLPDGLANLLDNGTVVSSINGGFPFCYVITDSDGNVLLSIDDNGGVSVRAQSTAGALTYKDEESAGYSYAVVDSADNILFGVDHEGNFVCKLKERETAIQAVEKASVANAEYLFYSEWKDGINTLYAQALGTQRVTVIMEANTAFHSLNAAPDAVYFSDGADSLWASAPEFRPFSAKSLNSLVCWGDSLTLGVGGDGGYTATLAGLTSLEVSNEGIGGQTSREIAARAGAVDIVVNAAGGLIPADVQAVNLSSIDQRPLTSQGRQSISGSLRGVKGLLSRNSADEFFFTRDAAGEVISLNSTGDIFIPDVGDLNQRICCIWVGRNNASDAQDVIDNVADIVSSLKNKAVRYLVLSVLNGAGEVSGTSAHANIVQNINAFLSSTYPDNYIDIRQVLIDAYDSTQSQDTQDRANDTIPSSLRSDSVHLNQSGYDVVAASVNDFLRNKGWIS